MLQRRLPNLLIADARPNRSGMMSRALGDKVRALAGDDRLPARRIVVDIIRADGLSDDDLAAVVLREIRAAAAGL